MSGMKADRRNHQRPRRGPCRLDAARRAARNRAAAHYPPFRCRRSPANAAVLSPLEGARRFRRGQVAHTLLARLPELPPETRRAVAIALRARETGLTKSWRTRALAVINHPDFAAAFGPDSQAEVAFQAALPQFGPQAQVTGRIDRLAVTDDEVLILDYKTNRPPPAREEDVDPVYLAQMALYRDGAARIFPGRQIVCGLVWTDGPALLRLSDAFWTARSRRFPPG